MSEPILSKSISSSTLLAGAGIFLAAAAMAFGVSRMGSHSGLVELSPQRVAFGEVKQNQMLEASFTVTNNSSRDLILDQFQTSCGCMTLSRVVGDQSEPIEDRIVVPPRQSIQLQTGMAVSTTKGQTTGSVTIRTNAMEFPQLDFEMTALVLGGLSAIPTAVNAGRLVEGEQKSLSIRVTDGNLKHPFVLDRVETDSTAIQVTALPAEDPTRTEIGLPVCTLQATVHGREPGLVAGEIRVFGKDDARPQLVVPVNVEILPQWSAIPRAVVFPRPGTADRYAVDVQILKSAVDPVEFKFESLPEWLVVEYVAVEDRGFRARLSVPESHRSQSHNIKLNLVRSEESESGRPVVLPVFLTPSPKLSDQAGE